jgi:hypothetical protein
MSYAHADSHGTYVLFRQADSANREITIGTATTLAHAITICNALNAVESDELIAFAAQLISWADSREAPSRTLPFE